MSYFSHLFGLLSAVLLFIGLNTSARAQILFTQQGNASYYSDYFHGRRMANGELYHRDSMTCAHLRYPLGTRLLVRNLVNGKEVVVTVTDRGPYTRKFVIDLSRAAARKLDIIQHGFQQVVIYPFIAGRVPFKYEPSTERPELDLGYTTDLDIGPPVWQDDSIYWARHRLSRTAVIQAYRDSLETTLREDTTLRQAIIKKPAAKKKEAQPSKKK
jgi:rare lipoprotein A